MKLIDNWRAELNRLWTTKAALIGTYVSVADQILTGFQMYLPAWVYAICFALIMWARLVDQTPAAANGTTPA